MKDKKKIIKEIKGWVLCIVAVLLISAFLKTEVLAGVKVQQSSMENTLYENEKLMMDKLSYKFTQPERGDIIIFHEGETNESIRNYTLEFFNNIILVGKTDDKSRLVKRVIGIPGDEVNIKDGVVYINDEKIDEPYVKGDTVNKGIKLPVIVGENQLFVLGDNRVVSMDSRMFGLINYNQVEGKVIFRMAPFSKIGTVK